MTVVDDVGLPGRWSGDPREKVRAAAGALGICLGGFLAGVVGIMASSAVVTLAGVADTTVVRYLSGNYIQVGFATFGLAYLARKSDRERFLRVRWPTLRDLGWVVAVLAAILGSSLLLGPVYAALGLPAPHPGDAGPALASSPVLLLVAFVGQYLFAAPAEELVYRGLIQGRLRGAFGLAGVVVVSAVLFSLLHVLAGLLTPSVGAPAVVRWGTSTFVGGLVWALAYERTENLVVTTLTHAMLWTVPFGQLLPLH